MTAATDRFEAEGLALHALTPDDKDGGAALSAEIGWNQVAADWRYMLANGAGYGRRDAAGRLIGSAMALPYGGFGWVCMVLVSPAFRRRGLATDLTRRVIDDLQAQGIVPGLDATPAGREVYKHLGFRDVYGLERLWADAVRVPTGEDDTPAVIRPLAAKDIAEIAEYDARTFGADRRALLEHLHARLPDRAFVGRVGEWPAGYVLARDGREATQFGPVVAEDADIAIALMRRALAGMKGGAVIDAAEHQTDFTAWLKSAGFVFQRPYTRMLLGTDRPFDDPHYVFAPAGPELG